MSVQIMPGWWDLLKDDFQPLLKALPGMINPNGVAQKKFQDLIQQDPTMLDKLSNFTPDQRAMFAQGMGFRGNTNPIAGMAEGDQLQERNRKKKAREMMTPDQQAQFMAKDAGVDTQESIDLGRDAVKKNNILFGQTTKLNEFKLDTEGMGAETAKIILNQRKEAEAKLQQLKKDNPNIDLDAITQALLSGNPQDLTPELQQQLQIVTSDPVAGPALKTIMETNQFNQSKALENRKVGLEARRLDVAVARASADAKEGKTDKTFQYLNTAFATSGNQLNSLNQQIEDAIAKNQMLGVDFGSTSKLAPRQQVVYDQYKALLAMKKALTTNYNSFGKALEEHVGPTFKFSQLPVEGDGSQAQEDPEVARAKSAIAQHPEMAAKIRAGYQAKYGKPLPE